MATSGLYGATSATTVTYFEWFVFQQSATAPATPTGGSWNFVTNTGTPPAGWSNTIPSSLTNPIYASIAFVDSRFPNTIVWSTPGLIGSQGPQGLAATVAAGTTTTGAAGSSASVVNSGTSSAAVFDFTIPRGDKGDTGAGVAAGGTTGQVLTKASGTDYDTAWTTITGTLNYQGSWNASTNSPTLTSSVGTNGYYYVVDTAGSTNLNGITDWQVGDWAIFNGSVWQKIDQTNTVTSVNGQTGTVVLGYADVGAANAGTNINITSMTGITGGIATADFLQLDTAITPSVGVAKLQWDTTWGGPQIGMEGGNVNLQIGQETLIRVYNNTGSALTDGQVVYVTGSQGQRLTVALAKADSDSTSAAIIGMVTEPIANNASGFVTTQGMVNAINTSGAADGAVVYLSPTTAGGWTTTKPVAPQHMVMVGYVVKGGSAGAGSIYINTQNGYELEELHNVLITSPTSGNTLIYDASVGVWKNANISAGTGISVTNGAGSISIANTGVTSVSGAGTVNGLTLTGTVTTTGSLTLGGTLNLSSPPAIGNVTPSSGAFTTLIASSDPSFTSTGAVQLPSGTTAQQPTGVAGKLRFNTTTSQFEGYNGTTWASVGGAAISNDTSTATAVYPLFAAATSGTALTVYTSNSNYLYTPSTGELKAKAHVSTNGVTVNSDSVSSNMTIAAGTNGFSVGPLTVNSGVTLTVASGQRHVII